MKRIHFGFLVVAAVVAQHAFADASAGENTSRYLSGACITSKTDAYDIGETMHEGDFKGQCMDVSARRPVVILSEDDDKIVIANFYHNKTYWTAEIPKSGVDQVIVQVASFPFPLPGVKFAHAQFRFVMKSGLSIKLTPQDSASKLAPTELDQFNLVDQPSTPKGLQDDYNPLKGAKSTYGNVLRAVGTVDRAHEELGGNDDTTRQFLLKMTDEERVAVMINGLHLSAKLGYDDTFKLFSENCTTTAFEILDESIKYERHVHKYKMATWDLHDPIAGPAIHALKERKLIEKELETWNEEMGLK
jgi:hypothetical protein